jgi:hypothetical protein
MDKSVWCYKRSLRLLNRRTLEEDSRRRLPKSSTPKKWKQGQNFTYWDAKNNGSMSKLGPRSSIASFVKSSTTKIRDFGFSVREVPKRSVRLSVSNSFRARVSSTSSSSRQQARQGCLKEILWRKRRRSSRHGFRGHCWVTNSVYVWFFILNVIDFEHNYIRESQQPDFVESSSTLLSQRPGNAPGVPCDAPIPGRAANLLIAASLVVFSSSLCHLRKIPSNSSSRRTVSS